jgi:dTDP-4-dehydrorhamnose reductase
VVNDQLGSPTFAKDLAEAVLGILSGEIHYGIYHFSNDGVTTWYDFAKEIRNIAGLTCDVQPIPTSAFPTPAKRPCYSVLDKQKITSTFNIRPRDWKQGLQECLTEILK